MGMFTLGFIIGIWAFMGLIATYIDVFFVRVINVPMIIFMAFVPMIPWVSHWCGLY